MTDLLSVTRNRRDGTSTLHRLVLEDDRYWVTSVVPARDAPEARVLAGVTTAAEAIGRTRLLHQARIDEHTDFACTEPSMLSARSVREAIRTVEVGTGRKIDGPVDPDAEDDAWTTFDEADTVWSTRHHITLNGDRFYGIPGTGLVVEAADYARPYDSWPDLLTFSWDSSDYSGVGMAGYGTAGLFRPHPTLIATVDATDETLEVSFDRIPSRIKDATLIERGVGSPVFSDRLWPHLVLAAHGYHAGDLYPGDNVTCTLSPQRLRSLTQHMLGDPA